MITNQKCVLNVPKLIKSRLNLIGLLAKRQSGKDTSADYLVANYGYKKKSFAEPLKSAVKELFGFSDEQIDGLDKEKVDKTWGVSPRHAFQVFGTDIIRERLPFLLSGLNVKKDYFWIKRFDVWYKQNRHEKIVISDVRFQNEIDYILANGGIIIKLEKDSIEKSIQDLHKSESEIDNMNGFMFCIKNNDTKESLYKTIDGLLALGEP